MKTSDIKPGMYALVRLTEEQSVVYRGCEVVAKVLRAGFHYDVTYVKGSMVRGAPFYRTQRSRLPQGVEIEWVEQYTDGSYRRDRSRERCGAGRAIVNARAVKFDLSPETAERILERNKP